ncbi:tRNA uridine-5-carboxymethylaminomethyl(34) synthesis GTPase MnmE [Lawsonibacter sp. LCP25S3_F5]
MSLPADTIAAISTPPGPGAIGILRLSGPRAIEVAQASFRPLNKVPLSQHRPHELVYGDLLDRDGQPIDRVLCTFSRGPVSYTGEDTAEFQCHGSPMVLSLGLEALFSRGARQARAGEFTRRAFLNGKLDLAQAEAVGDLLEARSREGARHAAGQLTGALSRRIGGVYSALVDVMAHFHAVLDYPDEDIDPFRMEELSHQLSQQESALRALAGSYRRGQYIRDGVPCAIVGRPNAGKSSLLNALVGFDRAIVTNIPGTTRDTVEERAELGGVTLCLIDTAGLRDSDDPIEQLGVERSRAAMDEAALVLLVVDGTEKPTQEDADLARTIAEAGKPFILVRSKRDLAGEHADELEALSQGAPTVSLSARTGEGLEELGQAVAALFPQGSEDKAGELITNARQAEAAGRALNCVVRANQALSDGVTPDALLTDVEEALEALGELTGQSVREDVTDRIFSKFCVGK